MIYLTKNNVKPGPKKVNSTLNRLKFIGKEKK